MSGVKKLNSVTRRRLVPIFIALFSLSRRADFKSSFTLFVATLEAYEPAKIDLSLDPDSRLGRRSGLPLALA